MSAPDETSPGERRPEVPPPASAATSTLNGTLELPDTMGALRGRDPRPDEPPPSLSGDDMLSALDAPLTDARPSRLPPAPGTPGRTVVIDAMREEALSQIRREGSWAVVLRVLAVLVGLVLAVRLAFDTALPRLLLGLMGAGVVLAVVTLFVQNQNEQRRQENLLRALAQLVDLSRARPEALAEVRDEMVSILGALRSNNGVWPGGGRRDELIRVLERAAGTLPAGEGTDRARPR